MRPESAGYSSLSECITHHRAKSQLTGQPLVVVGPGWWSAFYREQVCLDGGFLW